MFLSIDGVAPRAKLNQQRTRRFSSAIEREENKEIERLLIEDWEKFGFGKIEPQKEGFDSNSITPGTEFMESLKQAINQFIYERSQNNSLYQHLSIIFSDSSVKGEGEHKILDFIRGLRSFTLIREFTVRLFHDALRLWSRRRLDNAWFNHTRA